MQLESFPYLEDEFRPQKTVRRRHLPKRGITIIPIGDIQYDGTNRSAWEDLDKLIKETSKSPDVYYIGMGDYLDVASPSNRENYKAMVKYDSFNDALEAKIEDHLAFIQKILEPTRGRWLGLLQGHHYWEFSTGGTSDTRLCTFLKAPFLGECAMIQVEFENTGKHKTPSFIIWCHHGSSASDPIRKLINLSPSFNADLMLMAHTHTLASKKLNRVEAVFGEHGKEPFLRDREITLVSTGSYLKGYMQNSKRDGRFQGGYVEKGAMVPVALGSPTINAKPNINWHGYASVKINATI
jgi:hypothetical protein